MGVSPASTAYDAIAADYDAAVAPSSWVRERLWERLDGLFPPGSRVLDVTAGTGLDAVHLVGRGVAVTACDLSSEMLSRLTARAPGIPIAVADFNPPEEAGLEGPFDGLISTFAASTRRWTSPASPAPRPGWCAQGASSSCTSSIPAARKTLTVSIAGVEVPHRLWTRGSWRGSSPPISSSWVPAARVSSVLWTTLDATPARSSGTYPRGATSHPRPGGFHALEMTRHDRGPPRPFVLPEATIPSRSRRCGPMRRWRPSTRRPPARPRATRWRCSTPCWPTGEEEFAALARASTGRASSPSTRTSSTSSTRCAWATCAPAPAGWPRLGRAARRDGASPPAPRSRTIRDLLPARRRVRPARRGGPHPARAARRPHRAYANGRSTTIAGLALVPIAGRRCGGPRPARPSASPTVFPFPAWDLVDVERYRAAWRRRTATSASTWSPRAAARSTATGAPSRSGASATPCARRPTSPRRWRCVKRTLPARPHLVRRRHLRPPAALGARVRRDGRGARRRRSRSRSSRAST